MNVWNRELKWLNCSKSEAAITLTWRWRRFWLFGAWITVKRVYRGSYTVWRCATTGQRAGIFRGAALAAIWQRHRWLVDDEIGITWGP